MNRPTTSDNASETFPHFVIEIERKAINAMNVTGARAPHPSRRIAVGMIGAAVVFASGFAVTPHASASTLRDSIVSVAQRELNDDSRNYEYRGSDNCTYYSGQMTGWPVCNSSGWRGGSQNGDDTYAWCANFAKYIWKQAGVTDLGGLNTWARSFREYGLDNTTYHSRSSGYTPQPGDAIVFDWQQNGVIDHVGIVTRASDGRVYTIEGNASDRVSANDYSTSNVDIVGYSSPVGANAEEDTAGASTTTGDLGLVRTDDGILAQYRLGTDGWIYGSNQPRVGAGYGPWQRIGNRGAFTGNPAAIVAGNETIAVYARGVDDKIYGVGQPSPGAAFGGWGTIGTGQPSFASDPTAIMTSDGEIAIYATGSDGYVWGTAQSSPGSTFGAWGKIGTGGAGVASEPHVLIGANDTIVIYARGTDGKIHGVGQPSPGAAFGGWGTIGSGQPADGFKTAPSAVVTPAGTVAVYATGVDGYLWGAAQSSAGSAFGTWMKIGTGGAGVASRPQPLIAANGTIVIYARATDNKIRGVGQPSKGAAFGSWVTIGTGQPNFVGDPTAIVAESGAIVMYGKGTDNWIWGVGQSSAGGTFGNWFHIGS
ncbi:CHAP domain-containing protein [Micromonospora sp. GCM10011542]|uniref:CHAP domain-containing protein n=1 Tax=Micromonospora sp. GCM10011542 TaxID=3317337 RepID=UPI00361F5AEF